MRPLVRCLPLDCVAMKNRSSTRLSDCAFRHQWISEAAYYKAESRCFVSGKELDDWLFAEHAFITMQIKRYLVIVREDDGMSLHGLQRLAKSLGVENTETMTVAIDLIHAIQKVTNTDACFNLEPQAPCNTSEPCLWKAECKKMIARWCSSH